MMWAERRGFDTMITALVNIASAGMFSFFAQDVFVKTRTVCISVTDSFAQDILVKI